MKRLIAILSLFASLFAVDAFACQKYSQTVQDANGTVLAGTTVTIKLANSSTNATIYTDAVCSTVASNPLSSASDGYFTFYAKNGRYDIVFAKTGYSFTNANTSDYYLGEPMFGAGRLSYVAATTIQFCPFNGNAVYIPNGATRSYNIPAACLAAANTGTFLEGVGGSGLAASTLYYVYVFDNAGVLTIDFSTTGHVADSATGIHVKSGNASRAFIGLVRTNGSSQFADTYNNRFVLSYYNRRSIGGRNFFTANRTTTSTTFVEINTEIRVEFLTWDDEAVEVAIAGACNHSAGATSIVTIGLDGITPEETTTYCNATTVQAAHALTYRVGLSEGYHYATLLGRTASGTLTIIGGSTLGERTTMQTGTRG
jgi:hypothetical protein